jgi:hypothetical protein
MAKRKKSRRTSPPTLLNHIPQSEPIVRTDSSPPIAQSGVRTPVRNAIKKFAEWALGKALDYLLVGVGAIAIPPAIALWIYFRSGRAAWTYPWFYAALGFMAACFLIISMASLLNLIRARRNRAAERSINLEFLSQDKGYLDHAVNQARAFKMFNSLVGSLAAVMAKIGKTTGPRDRLHSFRTDHPYTLSELISVDRSTHFRENRQETEQSRDRDAIISR